MPLKIILSQRGNSMLHHGGCIYSVHRESDDSVNWRCVKYNNSCRARCVTTSKRKNGTIISESGEHNHLPNRAAIDAKSAVNKMKAKARKTKEPSSVVVASVLSNISKFVAPECPTRAALTRLVQRVRRADNPVVVEPSSFDDINMTDEYMNTSAGRQFYQQTDKTKENKILLFTTTKNLRALASSEVWFADGTFRTVPTLFYQLYTIHGIVNGDVVPLVFILTSNKLKRTYITILEKLKALNTDLSPKMVIADFEMAFLKAVAIVFPATNVKGCLFHFCNAIWKKIQQSGLQANYSDSAEYALQVRKLMALTFVPEDVVVPAYEKLLASKFYVEHEDEFEELFEYFERTWIGKMNRRGERRAALFDVSIWGHYSSVKMCHPRTNNSVEGWHNGFNNRAQSAHLSFWRFIRLLQSEQALTDFKLAQFDAGGAAQNLPRKRYRDKSARLYKIVSEYKGDNILSYLRAIAFNIILN